MGCDYGEIKLVAINIEQVVVPHVGLEFHGEVDQYSLLSAISRLKQDQKSEFEKSLNNLNRNLSNLISAGIRVLVVSEWPLALACTAAYALQLNFNYLVAHETRPNSILEKLEMLLIRGGEIGGVSVEMFGLSKNSEVVYLSQMFEQDIGAIANASIWDCHNCSEEYSSLDFDAGQERCPYCSGNRLNLKHEPVKQIAMNSQVWLGIIDHISEVISANAGRPSQNPCSHSVFHVERMLKRKNTFKQASKFSDPRWIEKGYNWTLTRELDQPANWNGARVLNSVCGGKFVEEPILNPDFVTQYEYSIDISLRNEIFDLLRILFPPEDISNRYQQQKEDPRYVSFFPFKDLMGEHVLVNMKNWRNSSSGPKVRLLHLEIIALVMASTLVLVEGRYTIVPAPSSQFSQQKPGQVSVRLASRVAELLGAPLMDMLSKNDEDEISIWNPFDSRCLDIVIIDDQITFGTTIQKCIQTISARGFRVFLVATWSYSSSKPPITR